jgi:hypothetical protein
VVKELTLIIQPILGFAPQSLSVELLNLAMWANDVLIPNSYLTLAVPPRQFPGNVGVNKKTLKGLEVCDIQLQLATVLT